MSFRRQAVERRHLYAPIGAQYYDRISPTSVGREGPAMRPAGHSFVAAVGSRAPPAAAHRVWATRCIHPRSAKVLHSREGPKAHLET